MRCEHYHAFCDLYGSTDCGGDCAKCKSKGAVKSTVTLDKLAEMYAKYAATHKTVIRPNTAVQNLGALRRVIGTMGISYDSYTSILSPEFFSQFAERNAGSMQPCSIKATMQCVANLTSTEAVKFYEERGLKVDKISLPAFKGAYKPWRSLSVAERAKLKDLHFEYRQLADPRKWLAMTFAWCFGMRKSDVLRLKWSQNFVNEDGRMWLDYTANKTGKQVHWPIDDDLWRELKRVKPIVQGMKRQHMSELTTDSVLRVRVYERNDMASNAIWSEMCADLRRVMGWSGSKAGHNLRKDSTDQIFQRYGIDLACEFSGDTPEVLRRSYIGKKRVPADVIAINKM